MSTIILLSVAVACLTIGFALLAVVVRRDVRGRPSRAGPLGAAVLVLAVLSGVFFSQYASAERRAGQDARLQAYERFSELPRIERLAVNGLGVHFDNADAVSVNGTMWLTVDLHPQSSFFAAPRTATKSGDARWLKIRVSAPSFDILPVLDEIQPIPNDVITFAWLLKAHEGGDQLVNVRGIAYWRDGAGLIHDRATVVNVMRAINVKTPFAFESWTPIITALIGLLGTSAIPLLLKGLSRQSSPHVAQVAPEQAPA